MVMSEKNVNLIDLLLSKDRDDFLVKKEEIEISSLSTMFGQPFIVEMCRMSLEQEAELEDYGYKLKMADKGKLQMAENNRKRKLLTLVYSIFYKGEALFKNTELISKFKVGTPTDLVLVLLTPDEIDTLFMAYDNLINNVPKEDEIKN